MEIDGDIVFLSYRLCHCISFCYGEYLLIYGINLKESARNVVFTRNQPGGTGENNVKSQSGQLFFKIRYKPRIPECEAGALRTPSRRSMNAAMEIKPYNSEY